MAKKKTANTKKICCDCFQDIPDPIRNELDKQGGIDGLLERIPDSTVLHAHGRFHQALADPIRLTVMHALRSQSLCVCVIKGVVGISDSKLSYHLNILKEQDLISGVQQGNWIIYSITDRGRNALKCLECMSR